MAIAARIEESAARAEERITAVEAAEEAVEDRFDDWIADDGVVDFLIESVSRKTKDYDADHPGARTDEAVFRGRAPSSITYTSRTEQPDEVAKIIQRVAALPPEHPALPIAAELTTANDQVRASHTAYLRAETALVEARAAAETAKLEVIQVYRSIRSEPRRPRPARRARRRT